MPKKYNHPKLIHDNLTVTQIPIKNIAFIYLSTYYSIKTIKLPAELLLHLYALMNAPLNRQHI